MAFDSKKFLVRTGSAAVFVIVLLGCILWNYYSFSALFFIVSLWGLHEFYKLMEVNGNKPNRLVGFLVSGLLFLCTFIIIFINSDYYPSPVVRESLNKVLIGSIVSALLVFMISPILELFRAKEKPIENLSVTVFGILYAVVPFCTLLFISIIYNKRDYIVHYNGFLILAIFLLIWSNDTFAYLVGSFIGKNKMYERISPGKTWEGTIGGAILTVASSFLIYKWFGILELNDWIIISTIVAVFGTLGDLVESMLKRSVGVKDSGNIMPGHGGILDRFDSLIMVAPFVFLYLILK